MVINSQSLSKEQVLIVGAGDIGARFAHFLPEDQYQVIGLRRRPPADLPYLHYRACDVTDAAQLQEHLTPELGVILVTMTPSERSDAGYEQAYVQTCRHLVAGLKANGCAPRLILFVSSTAVYDQMDGSWVDENSPTEPDTFSGKRLLEAEQVILESGFNSAIVRFSGIYGPGRNRLIEQVRQKRASASTHFTNRIHADDCARSLAHLVSLSRQQALESIYLASDSAPAPMLDVVTWLAAQMRVSDFLSDAAVNERGNKRCSNQRLLNTGFEFLYPEYKKGYLSLLKD